MNRIASYYLLILFMSGFSLTLSAAEEKAVLITGASSGLGLKMTETLSKNGFIVYAGARKEADLKRLEAMDNVESVKLDVTIQSEIDAAVKAVEKKGRGLYGLINNAGIAVFGPLVEVNIEQVEYQMNVNVYGPYRVTQAFAPMLIQSKGRIATTGSIAGVTSGPMFGIYAMSKHAIEAYTDSLALEMARFGVSVSVMEPGNYASQIGATALKRIQATDYWPENTQYTQERAGLLKGLAQASKGKDPQDVADAALSIMTSDKPALRYMVAPDEAQAERTLRSTLRKVLQLNQNQAYPMDLEALSKLLAEEATKLNPGK